MQPSCVWLELTRYDDAAVEGQPHYRRVKRLFRDGYWYLRTATTAYLTCRPGCCTPSQRGLAHRYIIKAFQGLEDAHY